MYISDIWIHEQFPCSNPQWLSFDNKRTKKELPQMTGNEYHIIFQEEKSEENHYTYIIGENGVGKSTLLHAIANDKNYFSYYYNGSPERNNYINPSEKTILEIGPGLNYLENHEQMDFPLKKVVDPNRNNIYRSFINIILGGTDLLKLAESIINKKAKKKIVTPAYSRDKFSRYRFEAKYGINLYIISNCLSVINSIDNASAYCMQQYNFLLEHLKIDRNSLANWVGQSSLFTRITSCFNSLKVFERENRKNTSDLYFVDKIKNSFGTTTIDFDLLMRVESKFEMDIEKKTDLKDLYFLLFFDAMGWVDIDVIFENKDRTNDIQEFSINKLSKGEQIILHLCAYFSLIPDGIRNDILFLYDEPENSLHPAWQKEFPLIFSKIVDVFNIRNSHFIFATHSPLIVMQAKKDDTVIRLERNNGDLNAVIIKDVHKFSIENLLGDLFKYSYYPKNQTEKLSKKLEDKKAEVERIERQYEDKIKEIDRLQVVDHSFRIIDSIDKMYNQIFPE